MENPNNHIKNKLKFNLQEISGGFGDLGTFIPIALALILICKMDAFSVLFWAGIMNIISGIIFRLPIPVQPIKAIATIAIAEGLSIGEIHAAGLSVGIIIFILGITGLVKKISISVPKAVVWGILLGIGSKLIFKGMSFIFKDNLNQTSVFAPLFLSIGFISAGFYLKKFPSALLVFILGIVLIIFRSRIPIDIGNMELSGFVFTFPGRSDWFTGFTICALPQVPLTLLNSVIAVSALSGNLFPGRAVNETRMALSVSAMNLVACLFGGMPMCHGSGGLAGQYRFGARSGGSVVFIGTVKVLTAFILGNEAINILKEYPQNILGLLLMAAGIELIRPALKKQKIPYVFITAATAILIFIFNTAIRFCAGLLLYSANHFILEKKS
ncbi:MAG: putative sulfate/molybdate transporter [bacterium]